MKIEEDQIPREWFCPITQELMKDPAIAADGFTYQRKAITHWFTRSDHSPLTNIKLPNTNLLPNHALRQTILQYLQKNSQNPQPVLKPSSSSHKPTYTIPEIHLNLDSAVDEIDGDLYVRCEIQPPQMPEGKRNSCSIICVLDVSESMDTDAVLGGKDVESHGFSRLDLVKHSIRTMVEFMDDGDEIALVPFSTSARIALPLTPTTSANKPRILQTTQSLQSIGTTNIWDGFKTSIQLLQQLHKRPQKNHNIFLVLLTDGQPNLNPPRGIVPTLVKFIELEKLPMPNIHVFGYGYEIDTGLLGEIAEVGVGVYGYIPDCSMVGTVFVNFMATALSTITNDVTISLNYSDKKYQPKQIVGYKKSQKNTYNLGILQYGQPRQFLLKFPSTLFPKPTQPNQPTQPLNLATITLTYSNKTLQKQLQVQLPLPPTAKNPQKMKQAINRNKYLGMLAMLGKLIKMKKVNIDSCKKIVEEFYWFVEKLEEGGHCELYEALMRELMNSGSQSQGQVYKAVEKEQWLQKWGRHYIPSLFRAHLMQICTNFKDPGLQLYSSPLFQTHRSTMDTLFIKMPPPQPSAKKLQKIVYKPAPVDMSDYYNQGGGCLHGDCLVQMEDGTKKMVRFLGKGDRVRGGVVECLVRSWVFDWVEMCKIGNLIITPWHPIRINGNWIFPHDYPQAQTQKIFIESFYNFVLSPSSPTTPSISLLCQGIQCISLGHNLNDNPVTSHEYLSNKITSDLKRSKGWQKGQVTIGKFVRDSGTRRIVGVQIKEELE